ncbi:MAG: Stp1/IreP family PP2C-type Ser/Thr phosphatase [Acidimicrobiia bacterium]
MRFVHGALTDVGRGRPANEDQYLVDPDAGLFAVADGMGGHRAGEVASATAIATLRQAFDAGSPLDEAIRDANAAVFAQAEANVDMRGMGTTLTAAVLVDGRIARLGHVGDSRAYLMRDGGVTQVTDDHSLVEQLVREGSLAPEDAVNHPQRAVITRALGIDPDVEVDLYDIDLRPGDRIVLCSDGLSNMVADEGIAAVLAAQRHPQQAAAALVEAALEAGGDDNVTVVVIDALGDVTAEASAASLALGAQRRVDEPTGEWVAFTEGEADEADEAEEAEETTTPEERQASAEPSPAPAAPHAGTEPTPAHRKARARRILAWVLPVILLLGAGVALVGWYARRTYYVGLHGDGVALYRGQPGGVLGWDPTVEEEGDLAASELTPADREGLAEGHRFSDRNDAVRFLERLERRYDGRGGSGSLTPTGASTSTTRGGR